MKKIKKVIVGLLFIVGLGALFNVSFTEKTYAATKDEALNWVKSQVGKSIDADGTNGCQCVDLILAYYDFLGAKRASGNGKDYATNKLPSGWERIKGATPQAGDILVYEGNASNPYGHVAIFESTYVHYHQNFNNIPQVSKVTFAYNSLGNPYWGVVRPKFTSGHNPYGSLDYASGGVQKVRVAGWALDDDSLKSALEIHVYIGGSAGGSGTKIGSGKANILRTDIGAAKPGAGNYHGFDFEVSTNKTGKQNVFVYAINVGGGSNIEIGRKTVTVYKDDCTNPSGHVYDNGKVTKAATCGADGVKTYTCTKCKKTKTEKIKATGKHTYDKGKITKEATYTETGVKTYTCTACGAKKEETIPMLEKDTAPPEIGSCRFKYEGNGFVRITYDIKDQSKTQGIVRVYDRENNYLAEYKGDWSDSGRPEILFDTRLLNGTYCKLWVTDEMGNETCEELLGYTLRDFTQIKEVELVLNGEDYSLANISNLEENLPYVIPVTFDTSVLKVVDDGAAPRISPVTLGYDCFYTIYKTWGTLDYFQTFHVVEKETVTIDKKQLHFEKAGDSALLTAKISSANLPDKTITWSSSDENVASVADDGTVTAVNAGETDIIAASKLNHATAICHVSVEGNKISDNFEITLSGNGGKPKKQKYKVIKNMSYGKLPAPSRSGYFFNGWYTKKSGGKKVTGETIVTSQMPRTLYAHWTKKKSVSKAKITVKSCTYTGKPQEPNVTVKVSGKKLKKDIDYTVSYSGNKSVSSKAKVKIKGIGKYRGSATKKFTIKRRSLKSSLISCKLSAENVAYNGKARKPAVTVTCGDIVLKSGKKKDYICSYKNNKNVGTATVTVTGKRNYTGTVKLKFKITKADQNISSVEAISGSSEEIGKSFSLQVKGIKEKAKVTYKSNDPEVASVSKTGNVKLCKAGSTEIIISVATTKHYNAVQKAIPVVVEEAALISDVGEAVLYQDYRQISDESDVAYSDEADEETIADELELDAEDVEFDMNQTEMMEQDN